MISKKTFNELYTPTINLAIPVILSQVGQVFVQLVDNAMVGQLGADPLAAVSFGGAVFFVVFIFCNGMALGLTPLVGEMYAKGNHRISSTYFQNSITLYAIIGVLAFVLLSVTGNFLHLMGQEPQVTELARPYFQYITWSIIPFMIFAAFKQFLEGIGNTKIAMMIVLTSNVINVLFNYLLIYGHWGFEPMGAAGAGLATLISRVCTPIFIIVYFLNKDTFKRYFSLFSWENINFEWIRSLVRVGFPIAMQLLMEGGVFALISIMMGWLGSKQLAANQIALSMANFAFMIVLGLGAATTIRVSHALGRQDFVGLKQIVKVSYHIGLIYNFLTAAIFIVFKDALPLIFSSDPMVVDIASKLMICVAVWQISDGIQVVTLGVLRGIKDVKSGMVVAFISYILITLPIGYLCAFVFDFGAVGLWFGFILGLGIAALLLITRWRMLRKRLFATK